MAPFLKSLGYSPIDATDEGRRGLPVLLEKLKNW
jgi:hypothetical protein